MSNAKLLLVLGLVSSALAGCAVEADPIADPAKPLAASGARQRDPRQADETALPEAAAPSRLFVAGGDVGGTEGYADVWSASIGVDGTLGAFEPEASLPAGRSGLSLVRTGGEILAVGGTEAGKPATDVLASIAGDRAIQHWRAVSKSAGAIGAGVTTDGTSLLVLGGVGTAGIRRDGFVATLESGLPGAFDATEPLPTARAHFGAAHVGPFVIAAGGETEVGATSEVVIGRPDALGNVSRWDAATALPKALSDHGVVASGDHLFVLGGLSTGLEKDILVSRIGDDGSVGAWKAATATLPSARRGHCVVASGSTLFVIGGVDEGGVIADVIVTSIGMNGSLSPWRTVAKLPEGRAHLGCAVR